MFKIGILIIGSLFWDEHPVRTNWRKERLNMNASTLVKCPIRYGRKSTSRGDSYTMVFSPGLETNQYGRAQVVPCLHNSFNLGGILDAAVELWAAETKNNPDRTKRRVSSKWGCVALLPNEKRMGDLAGILRAWEDLVSNESTYKSFRKNKDESIAHVSPNGHFKFLGQMTYMTHP